MPPGPPAKGPSLFNGNAPSTWQWADYNAFRYHGPVLLGGTLSMPQVAIVEEYRLTNYLNHPPLSPFCTSIFNLISPSLPFKSLNSTSLVRPKLSTSAIRSSTF